ncbi:hypothetical protein JXQ31_09770 [candidate division KSB1 bacterium]|nr:hypothetical protein [candidate division KSB1 bacterium]
MIDKLNKIVSGKNKLNLILYCVVIIGAIIVLSVLIKFDNVLKCPCRFVAQSEWTVVQNEPDKIMSVIRNNDSNIIQHFNLLHVSRPDFIDFNLNNDILKKGYIEQGESVANIFSYEDNIRLSGLQGLLNQTKADLAVLLTGDKPAVREEAEQALNVAKAELSAYSPQVERIRNLYNQKLVSERELEIAESTYELYKLNVSLADARLKSVESGAKQADIDKIKTVAADYENQINILQKKLKAQSIIAPISGVLRESFLDNTILFGVNKIDTLVVQIIIREHQLKYIEKEFPVNIHFNSMLGRVDTTRIDKISRTAETIYEKPMYIVQAKISNHDFSILPGMTGVAKIKTGRTDFYQIIKREWEKYLQR